MTTQGSTIRTEYGTDDGKKQIAEKEAKGKNIGKSNETSPEEQAEREATSMWQAKLDRKYRLTIKEAEMPLPLPMLAKSFDKEKKKVTYPCDVQPKMDGVRCLAQWEFGKVELTSRSGKAYNCPHIVAGLEKILPKNIILDGEIYIYGETFQQVTRLVKKIRPGSTELRLWVYDIIDTSNMELTWEERSKNLINFFDNLKCNVLVQVHSIEAQNETDIFEAQSEYLTEGYEGAIVRTSKGIYRWGYRSNALLKVKTFQDKEFKVIGYKSGIGKFHNACIWLCETETGAQFEVVSKGSMEYRRDLFKTAGDHLLKMLKVKFFERTESGIPRFPVGLGFRMEEDLD